jgi:hypothetical protein
MTDQDNNEGTPPVTEGVTGVAAIIKAVIDKRERKTLEDIGNEVLMLEGQRDRTPLAAIEGDRTEPRLVERGNGGLVSRRQPTDPLYRNLYRANPEYEFARTPDQDHWNVQWLRALRDNDRPAMQVARVKGNEAFQRANLLEGVLNATSATALTDGSAAPAEANPAVASVMMILTKLGARIILSDELLADSAFNVMDIAGRRVGEGIGVLVDTQILTSNGTSPNITGPLVGGAITEATATELNYEDPAGLFFSLGKAYQANGTWLAGTVLAQLLSQLTDGNGVQALKPTPGPIGPVTDVATTNAIGTIFGRPVYHCPAATAGDLIFGDLRSYGWATKAGIEVKVSNDVGFASDTTQFKFTLRADGQMLDTAGIKEFQGITKLG